MATPDEESLGRPTKGEQQDKIFQREAATRDSRANKDSSIIKGLLSNDPRRVRSFDADPINGLGAVDRELFRPGQFSLLPRSWQYAFEANDGTGRLKLSFKMMERSVDEVIVAGGGTNPNLLAPDLALKQTGRRRPDLDRFTAICDAKASDWIRQQNFKFLLNKPEKVFGPLLAEDAEYAKALATLPVMPDDIRRGVQLVEHHSLDWNLPFNSMALAAEHGAKHRNTGAAGLIDMLTRQGLDLAPGVSLKVRLIEVIVPYEAMMVNVAHMIGALPKSVATGPGGGTWEAIRALHGTDASLLPHIAATQTFFRQPHFFYWLEYEITVSNTGDLLFNLLPRVRLPGRASQTKDALRQAIENDPQLTETGKKSLLAQIEMISEADNPRLKIYRDAIAPIESRLILVAKSMHQLIPAKLKPFIRAP